MRNIIISKIFSILVVSSLVFLGLVIVNLHKIEIFAQTQQASLSGWAWSDNIGWISFDNRDSGTNTNINYSVSVDSTGLLSGYGWSENIGWITFNRNDLAGCPQSPCEARLDSSNNQLNGWARAYRAINPEGQILGGWEGWIKLSDANYKVVLGDSVNKWAWGGGGDSFNSAVIGWIDFSKVLLQGQQPPRSVQVSCNCSPSSCSGPRGGVAINYSVVDPNNNANWEFRIDGSMTNSGIGSVSQSYTSNDSIGSHTATIKALDQSGNIIDERSCPFEITSSPPSRPDADFECNLRRISDQTDDNWQSCDQINLFNYQWIYMRDKSSGTITERRWAITAYSGNNCSGSELTEGSWIFARGSACPPTGGKIECTEPIYPYQGYDNNSDNATKTIVMSLNGWFKLSLTVSGPGGSDTKEYCLQGRLIGNPQSPEPPW
jgi:hypothetical protein